MARITRSRNAIQVDKGDLAQINRELSEMLNKIQSYNKRREIAAPAGDVVIDEARRIAPRSRREHHRYRTPKLIGRIRAPNEKGVKVATYIPGNLALSIQDLGERRKKYRTYRTIIGPYYRSFKNLLTSGVYGKTARTSDGYYAHMVFGSSLAFRDEVTGRALQNKRGQVIEIIRRGVIRHFVDEARRNKKVN